MGVPLPEKMIFARTLRVAEHLKDRRPGREATPAKQGVSRAPSGGNALSGALVRMMIQWMSSQLLAGRTNLPSKVPPASREIVSPHLAESRAACRLSPLFRRWVEPGAGVSASELFM